jgi:hypothetical protein
VNGLLGKLIVRFLKGKWGTILPAIFKHAAEGDFGEPIKKAYWFTAGYRTIVGAALWAIGAGAETVCGSYPQFAWSCAAATWAYWIGAFLTGVGLADGGTRSPWPTTPDGQAPWQQEKK